MKITDKEQFQLKFLLGRSLFLGGGISLMLKFGDKDVWLAIILGFILGIPLIYLYSRVSFTSINDYLKQKTILNILIKISLLIFYTLFILSSLFKY